MTLSLVRARISVPELSRWAAERGRIQRRGFDEGRALHHLLAECVGPGKLQPFRLMVPPRGQSGSLYAYTEASGDELLESLRTVAPPEHLRVLAPETLETKPMPDDWRTGQRIGFDCRIRPVRRLASGLGKFAKGRELDAFLVAALRGEPDRTPAKPGPTRETVYLDWLAERIEGAASLDRVASRLAAVRRRRVARGEAELEGPEATVHGTLEITDPNRFAELLVRGIGRHRAYGYGMLLLRPPSAPPPER